VELDERRVKERCSAILGRLKILSDALKERGGLENYQGAQPAQSVPAGKLLQILKSKNGVGCCWFGALYELIVGI